MLGGSTTGVQGLPVGSPADAPLGQACGMRHGEVRNTVSGEATAGTVVQAGTIGRLYLQQGVAETSGDSLVEDAWVAAATGSTVWEHVQADRDVTTYQRQVALIVQVLAKLRDEAEQTLKADPWQDPGIPIRFVQRIEWLLAEGADGASLDIYPAEAALLVLVPFLYRSHSLQIAVRYSKVRPTRLNQKAEPDADRLSFEAFVEGHNMLAKRSLLRPEAASPISWWLFHRWLLQEKYANPEEVRDLLESIGEPAQAIGDILRPLRVLALLHGVRRGPEVCNPEFLYTLPADDRVRGIGHQRIRNQRLALLTALAYATSVEMVALPAIIVEHLGIPHPVDLDKLRDTVEVAHWGGPPGLPVLQVECHHEAVIEALREYTARADEVLHAISRTVRERIPHPMPALPARLSPDDVVPIEGVFDGWASFRLDERRIRDLLLGVQLYKDRDLAVRELYQNALDACRYRRARTQYLDRTEDAFYTYDGCIQFEQGTDENGRMYLECRDNGIGMGDAELRGVFSHAGARFAEQLDFKLEQSAWEVLDPPVKLFPNSRFGIGVLSYFMLADEIRVTTCRMGIAGKPGPLFEASIFGPGHLYRINKLAERGEEPGTRVRLYLQDRPQRTGEWSCVEVLKRLLGIAEFPTYARHGKRRAEWIAGLLKPRQRPRSERFGLDAHGEQVSWSDAPVGVQVIWTESGGALLADGLVVHPATRRGVLSSADAGLTGVVVNLSGEFAPAQLSVDRSQVLDEISSMLRKLLTPAVDALVSREEHLPNFAWLCQVADGSMKLADMLTAAMVKAGRRLTYAGSEVDISRTGFLPSDIQVVNAAQPRQTSRHDIPWSFIGDMPDHIYLWRLIAYRPNAALEELANFCPDLADIDQIAPAMPSDQLLLTHMSNESRYRHWNNGREAVKAFMDFVDSGEVMPRDAARRAALLGIHDLLPEGFPEGSVVSVSDLALAGDGNGGFITRAKVPTVTALRRAAIASKTSVPKLAAAWRGFGVEVPDEVIAVAVAAKDDLLLLKTHGDGKHGWLSPEEIIPAGRIAQASIEMGLRVPEVCAQLHDYGLKTDHQGLPDQPGQDILILLRNLCDTGGLWLNRSEMVPPAQVLMAAQELSIAPSEAWRKYVTLGFTPSTPFPSDPDVEDLSLFDDVLDRCILGCLPPGPFPYQLMLDATSRGYSLRGVITRLQEYGFTVPLRIPNHLDELDEEILRGMGPCSWWGVATGDSMPLAHIVVAAQSLHRSPRELAERFASYGVPASCPDLPDGLSFGKALDLLVVNKMDDHYLSKEDSMSLHDLFRRSRDMRTSLAQVASWLVQLGIPVPDIGETVRKAVGYVPIGPG